MAPSAPAHEVPIYVYGMITYTTAHRLAGDYPEADGYTEIEETFHVPGGEGGNAALLLARWGHPVKVGGPFLGRETREPVVAFLRGRGIDCSALEYDPGYEGVRDLVLVSGKIRTIFGTFGRYFREAKRWSAPDAGAVAAAAAAGIDPFFFRESERAAELCAAAGKPYVTIDCPPESPVHRGAAATVVAGEYLRGQFPGEDPRALFRRYSAATKGLVIFTFGAREILYARGDGEIRSFAPFRIRARSTLGAGDSFRAGVIHAVARGMDDRGIVQFAAATAAAACQRFPMALDPPGLDDIAAILAGARE